MDQKLGRISQGLDQGLGRISQGLAPSGGPGAQPPAETVNSNRPRPSLAPQPQDQGLGRISQGLAPGPGRISQGSKLQCRKWILGASSSVGNKSWKQAPM